MFSKKAVLKNSQYSQENTCVRVPEKETPTQVFSCEYCKIFKNTYFEEHLRTAASGFTGFRDFPSNIYLFKFNNRNIRKMCEIC